MNFSVISNKTQMNTSCFHALNIHSEREIGVLGSNSIQASYVHFRAKIIGKRMNPSPLPLCYGLNNRINQALKHFITLRYNDNFDLYKNSAKLKSNKIQGSACMVTDIVAGSEIGGTSSNFRVSCSVHFCLDALG